MPLRIETTASGARTASVSGRALHSARDPEREANRFLDETLKPRPSGFVVLGSCLGYIESALRKRYPALPRYSVQYDPGFRGKEEDAVRDAWYPDSPESLDSFLLSRLDPEDLDGLSILDWPPASQAYPEIAARCLGDVRKAVLTMNGSAAALQAFGPVRILNSVRSAATGRRFVPVRPGMWSKAVVIAAPGPSLEDALAELGEKRACYYLLALSSSARALAKARIKPDILVSSDPGYWASLHLDGLPWDDVPLAFPLSARVPRRSLETWPLIALDDGQGFDAALCGALSLPSLTVPESGTVSATALDLALRLSSGPIAFCGLDLSSLGIRSHCRPHSFDHFVSGSADRLRPAYSNAYAREAGNEKKGPIRVSPQLATYAAYFARVAQRVKRIFSLPSTSPGTCPLPVISLEELLRGHSRSPIDLPFTASSPKGRENIASIAMDRASRLIMKAMESLVDESRVEGVDRAILEQLSFSSLVKLRKADRNDDPELRAIALRELDERRDRLIFRMSRMPQKARP